ncbi:cytidine deaminase [Candidatus Marsarchaeota G2 archaeon ECH_B_SAG-G16]|uniref:cytidine deaminase n=1 Tax=Candidatus Marsarchaeota G2 archaeon ECH_B_SAG-G16 TaxID=1978167 RepID=A0A2R6BZK0_9ARCH|nr:MAG: cytidine deaminase [Candidatus Marsarchaeota G2 archaeon ECH_B_SAG-G16]
MDECPKKPSGLRFRKPCDYFFRPLRLHKTRIHTTQRESDWRSKRLTFKRIQLTMFMRKSTKNKLVKKAFEALRYSYSPYSKYAVGCALLSSDGRVFTGCNIENSSYSLTICAERVALFKAISEGATQFVAICVATNTENPPSMCGACRQALIEFSRNIVVIYASKIGVKTSNLQRLLPEPFLLQ